MQKKTKAEDKAIIKKQTEELLKLLLKKTDTKYKDIIELAEQEFIIENIGVLSAAEKKQFDRLVF